MKRDGRGLLTDGRDWAFLEIFYMPTSGGPCTIGSLLQCFERWVPLSETFDCLAIPSDLEWAEGTLGIARARHRL